MQLSIIIPAYNEAKYITPCLQSVLSALQTHRITNGRADVIVADNNSTDGTANLAREAGARVVFEPVNQISRARNAGARVAGGDWLLFIDADSVLSAESLADLLEHIESGKYAGGGSLVGLDKAPFGAKLGMMLWNLLASSFKWAAGSFIFCRADLFREVGGFSEELFASEELDLTRKIKQWGKPRRLGFAFLRRHRHISSGRKYYLYSKWEICGYLLRWLVFARSSMRSRKHLGFFYDGRR
jgi:glycosyltransferase involved in cell wall biosynthesis